MTLPAIPTSLTPATADEISGALKALFSQFPSHDSGDPRWRVAGYQDALSGEPLWAVERAVRRFLKGEVSSHDGRFLPTSAELARVVREESGYAKRMQERRERDAPQLTDQRDPEMLRIDREKRVKRLEELSALLAEESEQRRVGEPGQIAGPVTVTKELVEALDRWKGQAA